MILSIADKINKWLNDAMDFVEKNYTNPWFWLITFLVLLVLGMAMISKFADK